VVKIVSMEPGNGHRVGLRRRTARGCRHWSVTVDEATRRVTCDRCGEVLDPVDVLMEIARVGGEKRRGC